MHVRLFLTGLASAALLSAAGLVAAGADQPIKVTGCLQKDGGDYVLTQINEPPKGEPVARQDLKEAEHAYRLEAKSISDNNLASLVGHQVQINGTIAKPSDLNKQVGTSGSDQKKLSEHDLAKVDVTAIKNISSDCGNKK